MAEDKDQQDNEKGATFDMYHFFSSKDVILAAAVILIFLIILSLKLFSAPQGV